MTQLTEREAGDILRLAAADAPPGQAGPYAARALLEAVGVGVREEKPRVAEWYGQEAELLSSGGGIQLVRGRLCPLGSLATLDLADALRTECRLNRATLVAGYTAACRALAEIEDYERRRTKEKLPSTLNAGFLGSLLPLPGLPGILPPMVADFQRLGLIPLSEIGGGSDSGYERVASIDSPFRELVTWAYLQTAGRPGMPVRDVSGWSGEICSAFEEDENIEGG